MKTHVLALFLVSAASAQAPKTPTPLSPVDAARFRTLILTFDEAVRKTHEAEGAITVFQSEMRQRYNGSMCDLTPIGTWVNCNGKAK